MLCAPRTICLWKCWWFTRARFLSSSSLLIVVSLSTLKTLYKLDNVRGACASRNSDQQTCPRFESFVDGSFRCPTTSCVTRSPTPATYISTSGSPLSQSIPSEALIFYFIDGACLPINEPGGGNNVMKFSIRSDCVSPWPCNTSDVKACNVRGDFGLLGFIYARLWTFSLEIQYGDWSVPFTSTCTSLCILCLFDPDSLDVTAVKNSTGGCFWEMELTCQGEGIAFD